MTAFEIYVNKVKVCTAGIDDFEHLGTSLTSIVNPDRGPDDRKIYFSVHGKRDKKYYSWVQHQLRKGHRIEIRIVDVKKIDEPKEWKRSGGSCDT